jgi:hypothetical protein
VPGHLLEVRPAKFVPAQQRVTGMDGVFEVQTYGDKLHLFVDDVARRQPQLEAALAAEGIAHDAFREIEVRMEEAFISLINRYAHGEPQVDPPESLARRLE